MGTQRIHMSLYFTVITIDVIVVFVANRMRNIMLNIFKPVSVQVWRAISSRGMSLLRKVNGNMDSAKYQRDLNMVVQWQVNALCSHRMNISVYMISRHTTILKKTRSFLECKGIPVLEWPRNSPDMNPIEDVSNIMKKEIGNQMPCIK